MQTGKIITKIAFFVVMLTLTGCASLSLTKKQFIWNEPIKALKITVDYDPALYPSNTVCGKVTVQNYGKNDYKTVTLMMSFSDSAWNLNNKRFLATDTFCLTNGLSAGATAIIYPDITNPLDKVGGVFGNNTFTSCPISMNQGYIEINTETGPKLTCPAKSEERESTKTFEKIEKEPELWLQAEPFKKLKAGIFYIDVPKRATYTKTLSPDGLDILSYNFYEISEKCSESKSTRLEDYTVKYIYMDLIKTNSVRKEYSDQTEIITDEYIGVYFPCTASSDNPRIVCVTSKDLDMPKETEFRVFATTAQAEQIGRDAAFRIFFTIDDTTSSLYHRVGEYYRDPTPTVPMFSKSRRYNLYKGRFLGLRLIVENSPFGPLIAIPCDY
jgi:hypothetical protein